MLGSKVITEISDFYGMYPRRTHTEPLKHICPANNHFLLLVYGCASGVSINVQL